MTPPRGPAKAATKSTKPPTPRGAPTNQKKTRGSKSPKIVVENSEESVPLRTITLRATVGVWGAGPRFITSAEARAMFDDCTDRALRKWHAQGLPHETTASGELRYEVPAAVQWYTVRAVLIASRQWAGHTYLSPERAERLYLELQESDRLWSEPMVLVPLSHEHPARERMLRRAAEGLPAGVVPAGFRRPAKSKAARWREPVDYAEDYTDDE